MYHPSALNDDLQYQSRFEYSSGLVLYAGYAPPTAAESDSAWVVKKYFYSGTDVVKVAFADASNSFDKKWSVRTSYSY
jgi:hypothetical protein